MSGWSEWSRAYASQARADWEAYQVLREAPDLPKSQAFHFLQMACEKLCKAFLCKSRVDPRLVQASHAYIASNLPQIFAERRRTEGLPLRLRSTLTKQIRNLSREIELLAPTVDPMRRPDNCEYPWEDAEGNVLVPADYSFTTLTLLTQPARWELLKVLPTAIDESLT